MKNEMLCVVLLGCAKGTGSIDPPPSLYSVKLDSSFSSAEMQDVVQGIDNWSSAVGPDLTFSYNELPEGGAGPQGVNPATTLVVVRLSALTDLTVPCLLQGGPYGCYSGGVAYLAVDALFADVSMGYWQAGEPDPSDVMLVRMSSHEVGHFLGMQHNQTTSVMEAELPAMADRPTYYDVAEYCRLHRCPLKEGRDH